MFTKTTKVEKLKARSANILSIFTSTITNLEDINSEIADEAEVKLQKVQDLKTAAEVELVLWDELKDQQTANQKIISKIQQFLQD